MFTKSQLEDLYEAEVHFKSVLHSRTIISAPKWLTERVANIYGLATNQQVKINFNCATCVLNLYKTVAPHYFTDLQAYQQNQEQVKQTQVDKPKTKKSAKKNANKDKTTDK